MASDVHGRQQAKEVYVLLKKNYRISRNIRLNWFFKNVLKDVNGFPKAHSKDGRVEDTDGSEIQVLSWCGRLGTHPTDGSNPENCEVSENEVVSELKSEPPCILRPDTNVYFLSRGYRLVFALDLSPSLFQVSTLSYQTTAEHLLSRLAECLCCLVESFQVPNGDINLNPNIYVTVFTQTRQSHRADARYKQEIIVQGCLMTPSSIVTILKSVECKIYHERKEWNELRGLYSLQSARHDRGLVSILRTGLLALQLLPANTSAGIVVVTDGVVGVPDMAVLETLTNQLRCSATSCSVLHLRTPQSLFCNYAFCPSVELLKFISSATYGAFFDSNEEISLPEGGNMNAYHKGLLIWKFQLSEGKGGIPELQDVRDWEPEADLRYTPKQKNMYIAPILRKKQFEKILRVNIFSVLSVRLREGYMISSMSFGKSGNQLEINLVYPWNHSASVKYIATSAWPVEKKQTKIEVFIEGTFEFLFDMTSGVGQENSSRQRIIVFRRFSHFIKGLSQTDHMLMHLLSFTSDPVHYRGGQKQCPLFYLPPNSSQLVLSNENDSSKMFAAYWKPILSLDTNIWQKWMHTHHIDIILQHDVPLPKHLHIPSKSGRFHSIQTSTAMSQLASLLREWCTFVLLENHSYIKFVYKENEERPSSFFIVRLSNKAPVVVIRLAFLIGAPGPYRNQVLSELRDRVLSLTFPTNTKQLPSVNLRTSGLRSRHSSAQSHTRYLSGSERSCVTLYHKPLDRILIRYDHAPKDFHRPPVSSYRRMKGLSATSSKSETHAGGAIGSSSMMLDPCKYLEFSRSVWSVTNHSLTPLPQPVVGQIASLLVKLRLSEGFNIAITSSGVLTMVKEFTMIADECEGGCDNMYKCLCQYVLFPPTTCTSRERKNSSSDGSGDEEDDDAVEADGELLLSSETWIEPQCGIVVKVQDGGLDSRPSSRLSDSGRNSRFSSVSSSATTYAFTASQAIQRFIGSTCSGISKIIANEDKMLLSVLITMEHLRLMCVPKSVVYTLPQQSRLRKRSAQADTEELVGTLSEEESPCYEGITHNYCLFDLIALLDRCPQTKLLFMTLTQGSTENADVSSPNDCLFELFQKSLKKISDREAHLSQEDCLNITDHICRRENKTSDRESTDSDKTPGPKWKCYLKILSKSKMMLILLPASHEDLKKVLSCIPNFGNAKPNVAGNALNTQDSIPENLPCAEFGMPVSPDGNGISGELKTDITEKQTPFGDEARRLSRRRSIKRMISTASEEKENQDLSGFDTLEKQTLPMYVYECSTNSLVDALVKEPSLIPLWSDMDTEIDFRIKPVDIKFDPELVKPKFFRSQSYPFHSFQRFGKNGDEFLSPPAEDVFSSAATVPWQSSDSQSALFHNSIAELYNRCFVTAVSNNLRRNDGYNVANVDIEAVTGAMCVESVQEIDITQFLLITCPQVAAFRNQHLSQDIDQRDNDDVFSLVAPQFPVPPSHDRKVRHKSSTSSNTDSSSKRIATQKRSASRSPDQLTRGQKYQTSGINGIEPISADTAEKHEMDKTTAKQSRSAFKKLRKRPHSLPKSVGPPGKEKCDTDDDTPEMAAKAFLPVHPADSNVSPIHPADSNVSPTKDAPNTDSASLPRSLMVGKPVVKLPVTSKFGWSDLPEFPISMLKESHLRHISGNDEQVQMNFQKLISQNFHPIQTIPDIFYYEPRGLETPLNNHDERQIQFGDRTAEEEECKEPVNSVGNESDQDVKFELSESEAAPFMLNIEDVDYEAVNSDLEKARDAIKKKRLKRQKHHLGDLEDHFQESFRFGSSAASGSSSENGGDSECEEDTPLFLYMACTVRDKKTGNHGTTVVEGLPTTLRSVLDTLENDCETIDLSKLSVTLDLIWIVLSPELKKTEVFSDSESKFSSGLVPEDEDSPRHESLTSKQRNHTLHEDQDVTEPLLALPPAHLNAVETTKTEVEWLLKDEIICALRTCETIDMFTLEKVARHVEESKMDNCMMHTNNLQFVFGAEKSFQLFNTLFEKMFKNFKGYRMKKEGDYYYFTTERTFLPIQHWRGDRFTVGNGNFQLEQGSVEADPGTTSHSLHQAHGSASSGGKPSVESRKEESLQHSLISRTKTTPDTLQSPPRRLTASTKPYTTLVQSMNSMHSSLSFHSLPDNESMSLEAIESDVGGGIEISATKRASSSQSTPIRKTSSAFDMASPAVSSPGYNDRSSPTVRANAAKSGRATQSRLSLPNAITHNSSAEKSGKKKRPIKQRSVESNLNNSGKNLQKRHSATVVTPISLRNSPLQHSGPASPLAAKYCHNSSSGSMGSAPTCRRRSMNSVTPVSQLVQRGGMSISSEPSSSTPLNKGDNSNEQGQCMPSVLANSTYLFGGGNKESAASPVSVSDSEPRRYSTASWLESGYDGEESDLDAEDGYIHSLDDANDLPSFWLIVHVLHGIVKMYCHRRNSAAVPRTTIVELKRVFDTVKEFVDITCKQVNQTLLLLELHDSRMCNALLVEETEEDIWRRDYQYANFGISDEHGDDSDRALLAATMTNAPGQFACDCVHETSIPLHPRLKSLGNVSGKSSVIATVKDLVINLMVSNRKNMFVYQLTDKSVFYCRMEEIGGGPHSAKADSRRSSQLFQTPTPSLEAGIDFNDRRTSRESLANVGQPDASKTYASLSLRWHGVGPLSPQQENELEKMNESIIKKLNDSVLEKITVILQRNSKLSSSDVQFIQPSVQSPTVSGSPIISKVRQVCPNYTLSYGLPDEFVGCLNAVKYYLHQNLLQFMATPRYADATQPSGQFVSYRMKTPPSDSVLKIASSQISEGCVFLFHQSIERGKTGYGIACVVLEITDAEGNQIPTESNSKLPFTDELNIDQLVSLTEVIDSQEVVSASTSRSNTPAIPEQNPPVVRKKSASLAKSYVRFHLWLKGSLTLGHLNEKLRPAIRHALFDVITELLILKAPLCDSEQPGTQDVDVVGAMEAQKSQKHPTSGKTDAMRSLIPSLNEPNVPGRGILTTLFRSNLDSNVKEESSSKVTGGSRKGSSALDRRKSAGVSREAGDNGNLREVYKDSSKVWFDTMEKNGCPSVFKVSWRLSSASHLENFLQNVKKIFKSSVTECQVRIFSCDYADSKALKFNPAAKRKTIPGRYPTYIVVARNIQLWLKSIGTQIAPHSAASTAKFSPYDPSFKPEQSPRNQDYRFSGSHVGYIPRQQFISVHIQSRQLNLLGYNISNEIASSLQSKLLNCVNFHNGRWRALDCLTFQKLSLFRHCMFETGYPTLETGRKGCNPFTQDIKDVDVVLMHSGVPSESEILSQKRTKSNRRAFFNEAYFSNVPLKPLSITQYGEETDVATQYAKQYLEMKANLKKRNEEQQLMHRVYTTNWRERPTSISNIAFTKDNFLVLLRHTRLIHHVTSPILFSPSMRKELSRVKGLEKNSGTAVTKDPLHSKRRKRMSGSIRRSGEYTGKNLDEPKSRSRSNSAQKDGTKQKGSKTNLVELTQESPEESRFDLVELKKSMVMQYVQYWQSMHFILVKEDRRSKNDKTTKKSHSLGKSGMRQDKSKGLPDNPPSSSVSGGSTNGDRTADVEQPVYLYRVSPGGIIIVEITFAALNFSVKLHVIEASRLQHQLTLNQQMNILFLNECEQLKNLTHVHSFMYDFHLRYIQWYVDERQTAIKQGYHVVSLLRYFTEYYKVPPPCASNQIHRGNIDAACSHVTANELYEYLVGKQASQLKFKTLKLVADDGERIEHALVSAHLVIEKTHSPYCNQEEHDVYDIGYVVWHNTDEQKVVEGKIELSYFILFTNRRHIFPRLYRHENRPTVVFPVRRGSTNVAPKSTNVEKKPSDEMTSPTRVPTLSSVFKQHGNSPTSQSTSSLQRLGKEVLPETEHETSGKTIHLSPVTSRKFAREKNPTQKSNLSGLESPQSPPSMKHQDVFTSPAPMSFIRKKAFAHGRRQSMPNVAAAPAALMQAETANQTQSPLTHEHSLIATRMESRDSSGPASFVQCEMNRLRNYLANICSLAEIQCYRNQLWDKVYTDKSSQNKTSGLTVKDFEHLLKHCQVVPLSKLDPRGHSLCDTATMGLGWAMKLQKQMIAKFDKICRYFVNNEVSKIHLGVLNPKLYPMMFLISVDTDEKKIGMYIVMRDKLAELDKDEPCLSNGNATIIPLMGHVKDMIGFICYHTWSNLLST